MALTQEQKAALLQQSQVAAPEPAAVVEKPDKAVLQGAMAGGGESDAARLRRLKKEQAKAETDRLAAQQASTPDLEALEQDAKLKLEKADQLFAEHKAIDATWETDGDLDKWYGSKIAELEARLESNEAMKKLADVVKDYNVQSATTANILDLTGQLAKNKKEYEQIQAGTHAWVKSADGSKWTFEEVVAEEPAAVGAKAPIAQTSTIFEARRSPEFEEREWAYSDDELFAIAEKGDFPSGLELTKDERKKGGGLFPKLAPMEPQFRTLPNSKYERFVWLRNRRENIRKDEMEKIKREKTLPTAIKVLTGTIAASAWWIWGPVITGLSVAKLKAYAVSIGVDLAIFYGAAKYGQWLQEDELEDLRKEVDKLKQQQGVPDWDQTDDGDTGQ